jgi:hypothetical protein
MSSITRTLGTMLPEGNPVEKIDAIMERVDAEAYIKALPGNVLYQLIKEAGWDQGVDLVPFASPEQVQLFIDFDAWRRDALVPVRMTPWLAALVEDARDKDFQRAMREIDGEVLAMLFSSQLEVMEMDEGRIPDHAPDRAVTSPDGVYAIVYPEDESLAALMRKLIDRLYELDRVLAWTLLEAVRWELPTEMEEYALRWRTSRLEEFGFVARDEAASVYTPLPPDRLRERLEKEDAAKVRMRAPGESLDLPSVVAGELEEDALIVRVLMRIPDEERRLARFFELSALVNKVMLADGIEPGELNSGRQVMRRALGYMGLGLEFITRGQANRQDEILERASLKDIFRAGYTLTAQLQRQVQQLERRPTLTLIEGLPYSLLGEDDAALLEGLSRQRPTYAADAYTHAIFEHQHQLDDAAMRLGMIAFKQLWVFGLSRLQVADLIARATDDSLLNDPIDVTFDTLFRTWVARQIIDKQDGVQALSREEVGALLVALRDRGWEKTSWREHFASAFEALGPFLPGGTDLLFERWFARALEVLVDELGQLKVASDATFAQQVVLLRG